MTKRLARTYLAVVITACAGVAGGCNGGAGWRGDEGDRCTILLTTFQSARHSEEARFFTDALERSGWGNLTPINKGGHSELFWGEYASIEAGQADLVKAQNYTNQRGTRPFRQARLVALPGAEVGPPQWRLLGAKGTYTVVVGLYYEVAGKKPFGRRRTAVDQCKVLRKAGHEAYYHHSPVRSYVTVGTFGEEALKIVEGENTVEEVIVDSRITKIRQEFKTLSDNGYSRLVYINEPIPGTTRTRRKRGYKIPYVVEIPRRPDDDLTADRRAGKWQRH